MQQKAIDFVYLQKIIIAGIKQMQIKAVFKDAIFLLGDTGVGKSTLMTYMLGQSLTISQTGLKPNLSGPQNSKIKIGHNKYSQTSVPNQFIINDKVFYDCPGFNDNKSQECDIANSFYLQRLFDLYQRTKIVLVIDETYLTQARAHRLPQLISKLRNSFGDLNRINKSVLLIINRCNTDFSQEEIIGQFNKLLKTDKLEHFKEQQRTFFRQILLKNQYYLFPSPKRIQIGKVFPSKYRQQLMESIDSLDCSERIKINNIISQNTKLAIRDYIDKLTLNSEEKVFNLCQQIKNNLTINNKKIDQLYQLKESMINLVDLTHKMQHKNDFSEFFQFYDRIAKHQNSIKELQEQIKIVSFFRGVYNKTEAYYKSITNGFIKNISLMLMDIDKKILQISKSKPIKVFEELITNSQSDQVKSQPQPKTYKKNQGYLHKKVTIDQSCLTETTQFDTKPITFEGIFTRGSLKFSNIEKKDNQIQDPVINFKKKLIEAEYKLKQLGCEAELFHHKMKMAARGTGVII